MDRREVGWMTFHFPFHLGIDEMFAPHYMYLQRPLQWWNWGLWVGCEHLTEFSLAGPGVTGGG